MANHTNQTTTVMVNAPENVKYDDRVLKKIVATSLMDIDGFLGTTNGIVGGITAMLRKEVTAEEEVVKGIGVSLKDGEVDVTVKAITENGKNIPDIVKNITESVTAALRDIGGLATKGVNVEIVDTMTRAEFDEKYLKAKKEEATATEK